MNPETVRKAQESAKTLADDLEIAFRDLCQIPLPPEGRSVEHYATLAYIADLKGDAHKLFARLARLG